MFKYKNLFILSFILIPISIYAYNLEIKTLDFNKERQAWSYQITYRVGKIKNSLIELNNKVLFKNIKVDGVYKSKELLKPNTKYTFELISNEKNTKNKVLEKKTITTPSKPVVPENFTITGQRCIFDYSLAKESKQNSKRLLDACDRAVPFIENKFNIRNTTKKYKIQFYTPSEENPIQNNALAFAIETGMFLNLNEWQKPFITDEKIIAHELTHLIQAYTGYNSTEYPAILIEALADYGAYIAGYENDLKTNCYHFSNQRQMGVFECTYKFLLFIENKYDKNFSVKINNDIKKGIYSGELFIKYTGKDYNTLIKECSLNKECAGVDPL